MSSRVVTAWIVPLKGDTFDLEELPIYLGNSPIAVVKRGESYFLRLSTSIAGTSYERVSDLSNEYLGLINGAARVLIDGYRPIEIETGMVYGIDANAEIAHTILQLGSAEERLKGGHVTVSVNGITPPDPREGLMTALLKVAVCNQAKADALALIGRPSPTWSELYLIFELVKTNVGGRMYTEGWIDKTEKKLFTGTANSYTALGRAGRHGKDSGKAPAETMQLQAAITLMRSLVAGWLRDDSTSNPVG